MNKFPKYFPRADLSLGEDKLLIGEEQLITIVHHALHGIMQLQIQRAGLTINEFKTLDDLKVFFEQQYECDMLEKRILKRDDDEKEHKKEKKAKKTKKRKKTTTTTMTTPKNIGRVIENLPRSQHAVSVVKLGIATRTVGLWTKMQRSVQPTFRQPTQFSKNQNMPRNC
jgi:hypothetical protein